MKAFLEKLRNFWNLVPDAVKHGSYGFVIGLILGRIL